MGLLLFYLFAALFISFICSVLEAVLLSITPSYIGSLPPGSVQRERLQALKKNLDSALSAILILNTFAHTMGAAGVGAEAIRLYGPEWQSLIAIILTLLILYVSEIIPKTIGATYWRELAKPSATFITFLVKILYPLIWISRQITRRIQKNKTDGMTREEISAMLMMSEESGILEEKEEMLIQNLLLLKQVRVRDILTPRSVVFSLNADESIESALQEKALFVHSRIPLYEQSSENIVGMVFSRNILRSTALEEEEEKPLKTIMKPVFSVSENLPVFYLMDKFIKRKEHLFIVRDNYEQYVGIVTLEDAIETLLGVEIVDEADTVTDMQQHAKDQSAYKKQERREQQ